MPIYQWRSGRSFPVSAEVVGAFVEEAVATQGKVTPNDLVEAARSAKSELHPLFEWNNSVAANEHRLHQARTALSSLRIRISVESPVSSIPAFLSVSVATNDHTEPGYTSFSVIEHDPDLRRDAVLREWRQIRGWIQRTEWISEFQPLRDAAVEIEIALAGGGITGVIAVLRAE